LSICSRVVDGTDGVVVDHWELVVDLGAWDSAGNFEPSHEIEFD
jgi:hypothetical protein